MNVTTKVLHLHMTHQHVYKVSSKVNVTRIALRRQALLQSVEKAFGRDLHFAEGKRNMNFTSALSFCLSVQIEWSSDPWRFGRSASYSATTLAMPGSTWVATARSSQNSRGRVDVWLSWQLMIYFDWGWVKVRGLGWGLNYGCFGLTGELVNWLVSFEVAMGFWAFLIWSPKVQGDEPACQVIICSMQKII